MANLSIHNEYYEKPRPDRPGHWIKLFVAVVLVALVLVTGWKLAEYLGTGYELQGAGAAAFLAWWWLFNKKQDRKREGKA